MRADIVVCFDRERFTANSNVAAGERFGKFYWPLAAGLKILLASEQNNSHMRVIRSHCRGLTRLMGCSS